MGGLGRRECRKGGHGEEKDLQCDDGSSAARVGGQLLDRRRDWAWRRTGVCGWGKAVGDAITSVPHVRRRSRRMWKVEGVWGLVGDGAGTRGLGPTSGSGCGWRESDSVAIRRVECVVAGTVSWTCVSGVDQVALRGCGG